MWRFNEISLHRPRLLWQSRPCCGSGDWIWKDDSPQSCRLSRIFRSIILHCSSNSRIWTSIMDCSFSRKRNPKGLGIRKKCWSISGRKFREIRLAQICNSSEKICCRKKIKYKIRGTYRSIISFRIWCHLTRALLSQSRLERLARGSWNR